MPITLEPPLSARERILGFGSEGTGKTSAYLSIARAIPTATFHVIDNDNTLERLLGTDFTDVRDRGQVIPYETYNFDETTQAIVDIQSQMTRDDWMVIDTAGKIWDQVQEWFTDQIFQEDIGDYFLKVRLEKEALKQRAKGNGGKDSKSLGAFEGWMDWPVINKIYHDRVSKKLLQCPGHLFITSEANKLAQEKQGQPGEERGVKELYGQLGSKPAGQKRLGHMMHTVLFFSRMRGGSFKLTTVKDRGRYNWNTEEFGDFANDYLIQTAGWTKGFVQ